VKLSKRRVGRVAQGGDHAAHLPDADRLARLDFEFVDGFEGFNVRLAKRDLFDLRALMIDGELEIMGDGLPVHHAPACG